MLPALKIAPGARTMLWLFAFGVILWFWFDPVSYLESLASDSLWPFMLT